MQLAIFLTSSFIFGGLASEAWVLFLVQGERKKVQCEARPLHPTNKKFGASVNS